MTTKKQLPVWRMNTGKGVPSDLGNLSMYGDGEMLPTSRADRVRSDIWKLRDCWFDIIAYQTTRTKAAKYRRK